MSDYLARLVQRAQPPAAIQASSAALTTPADMIASADIDDPFEVEGEPDPPIWPASTASRPTTAPQPLSAPAGIDARPEFGVERPFSPETEIAAPIAPEPARPVEAPVLTSRDEEQPPLHGRPAEVVSESWDEPAPIADSVADLPPQALADAFMRGVAPPAPPAAKAAARAPSEPSQPRAIPPAAPEWRPQTAPAGEPAAHSAAPPSISEEMGERPLLEPPAPPARINIGRLTVTVERNAPLPPPTTVTRIVRPPAERPNRSRPRFGVAQS